MAKETKRTMPRWSEADLKLLGDAVKAEPTRKAAIEQVAKATGRSVGTVSQKFYSMERKRKETKKAAPVPAAAATKPATASNGNPYSTLQKMPVEELVKLQAALKAEVGRRRSELAKIEKAFGK